FFHLSFGAVGLEERRGLGARFTPGRASAPRLLAAQLQDPPQVFLLRRFLIGRSRDFVESGLRELGVAVQAFDGGRGINRIADRAEDGLHGAFERLAAAGARRGVRRRFRSAFAAVGGRAWG